MSDHPPEAASSHVLDKAEQLFLEKGYAQTKLRDLAASLDMKPASLYYHAPGGKEELWNRVIERAMKRHKLQLTQAAAQAGNDLRSQLQAMSDWLISQPSVNIVSLASASINSSDSEKFTQNGMISLRRSNRKPRYRWWQAALVGVGANLISAAPAGYNGDEAFYNNFSKPKVAPPDWLFAPVWLFNNVTTLYANLRVANLPENTPGRRANLWLEGAGWLLFSSFSPLYFGLKSPVLGAVNTVLGFGVGAASLAVATQLDRRAAWAISPRVAWLLLATYISIATAATNQDEFLEKANDASDKGDGLGKSDG